MFFHVKLCLFFELQDVSKIHEHLISSDSMANSCSPSLLSPVFPCIQLRLIQTFQTFEWICCNRFCASQHQGKQNWQNDMGTMWYYHQYYINIAKTMSRHVMTCLHWPRKPRKADAFQILRVRFLSCPRHVWVTLSGFSGSISFEVSSLCPVRNVRHVIIIT